MGKQIILVHGSLDWKECLTVYWGRDIIEKAFRSLKTDLQVMPLNVGTEATLKGYLFITFLSPILRVRLLKHMRIYRSAGALYLGGTSPGTGKDQEDLAGERRGHHDGDLETATDDPDTREVSANSPGSQVGSILMDINEEWVGGRKYLTLWEE